MNQKPKWLGEPDAPIEDVLGLIATGGVAPGNVEILSGDPVPAQPIALDCVMQKVAHMTPAQQVKLRKLVAGWWTMKRLGIIGLSDQELGGLLSRLPERVY